MPHIWPLNLIVWNYAFVELEKSENPDIFPEKIYRQLFDALFLGKCDKNIFSIIFDLIDFKVNVNIWENVYHFLELWPTFEYIH